MVRGRPDNTSLALGLCVGVSSVVSLGVCSRKEAMRSTRSFNISSFVCTV